MPEGWEEILYKSSPEYVMAYQDGYEQAKFEMSEVIKNMTALYEASTTSTR